MTSARFGIGAKGAGFGTHGDLSMRVARDNIGLAGQYICKARTIEWYHSHSKKRRAHGAIEQVIFQDGEQVLFQEGEELKRL